MLKKWIFISSSLLPLWLAGCNGGAAPVDSQKYLNTLDGPKVTGVNDAFLQTATQAEAQGNFKLAAQTYEQILDKEPENASAILALADAYRRDGQTTKAISAYNVLLSMDAKNIAAKEGKCLALIANGDFDTPAPLLDEVMQVDAKRWKTLNALGVLFTTRNMQPEAQQYFREALKYHPDSASILNNIGLSQALQRNYDGSLATLAKASGLADAASIERKRIDLNSALVLASAGKTDEAKAIAEHYLSGAELDNNLGLYAHLAQDDTMAKAYLNKALSDSKVYYAKAWDNLEDINKNGGGDAVSAAAQPAKKPSEKKTNIKKTANRNGVKTPELAAKQNTSLLPEAALAPSAGGSGFYTPSPDMLPEATLADAPPAPARPSLRNNP